MKVAFIARATLHSSPGGDTRQMEETAAALSALGIEVDVLLTDRKIDSTQYDLLHFFNIIRPADILRHIYGTTVPYVVSTIFVEYSDYEKRSGSGWRRALSFLLGDDRMEWIKAIARRAKNGERIGSSRYVLLGHRNAVRFVAGRAAMLLPNSENEYRRFIKRYSVPRPYRVIPNGINKQMVTVSSTGNDLYKDSVICVGRIEGRKNQLNLIRAMNNLPFRVFIIGEASPNHRAYLEQCKSEAGPNIQFIDWLPWEELFRIYRAARVHVLPSYFETTGLSSLEAAVMGCNIVVGDCGDVRDYFGEDAWYCRPEDPVSVRAAVEAAFEAPYDEAFRRRILENFTWERAGAETLLAYRQVLNEKNPEDISSL